MSEIARVEKFMLAHASPGFPHRYFFPPPYEESANALRGFTSEEIIFLKDGELTGDMLDAQGSNFLIVNDQCSFIHVSGVRLEKKVFINGTWEIRKVIADKTMGKNLYGAQFHLNFVQKIKKWIRDLQ